ncbi:MAG: hypothetical protein D6780_03160 [Candidatus Dadabacteria bacterium]|nr:MAG: hypothetical protein D6780_03160 [Candidatus Dadabacteria bacterium]
MVFKRILFLVVWLTAGLAVNVYALPFNDDMVHDQPSVGEIMRQEPEGSIPLGFNRRDYGGKQAALKLENPSKGDEFSVERGKRLWRINCSPCHGVYKEDGTIERLIPMAKMPGPDLRQGERYLNLPDGFFFGTIYYGGAIMPRYGYKLSEQEIWDIVNYIRSEQERLKLKGK